MITLHGVGVQVQSYVVVAMGYIDHYDLMHIGAAVLLIARLICDVPPAYQYLKSKFTKDKI